MTVVGVQERSGKLATYLRLLLDLGSELERAMEAISRNALADFEDSVSNQEILSEQLVALGRDARKQFGNAAMTASPQLDGDLAQQVRNASSSLQTLNRRYSVLLQHSGRSIEMMVSLFSSYRGQIQEGSGAGLKHQTWSCQI
jgi:hypothetical protein